MILKRFIFIAEKTAQETVIGCYRKHSLLSSALSDVSPLLSLLIIFTVCNRSAPVLLCHLFMRQPDNTPVKCSIMNGYYRLEVFSPSQNNAVQPAHPVPASSFQTASVAEQARGCCLSKMWRGVSVQLVQPLFDKALSHKTDENQINHKANILRIRAVLTGYLCSRIVTFLSCWFSQTADIHHKHLHFFG